MKVHPTDAGAIDLIIELTLRTIANKDALKAYGIDCRQVKNNELHADVLACVAHIRQRDAQAAEAIKERGIWFIEDKAMVQAVADAGVDMANRHTIRLSPAHLLPMTSAERRAVIAHEVAHVLLGHAGQMLTAPAKAKWLMHDAFEVEAWRCVEAWGFQT